MEQEATVKLISKKVTQMNLLAPKKVMKVRSNIFLALFIVYL